MIRYAASLAQADVQAAIDASSVGDTIVMPAGSATWTTHAYGGADGSGIGGLAGRTLKGAGLGLTIITDACQATYAHGAIAMGDGTCLEDFTIQQDDTLYSQGVIFGGNAQGFAVAFCQVSNVIRRGIHFYGGPHARGVIYGCRLIAKSFASPGDGLFQLVTVEGPDNANTSTPPTQSMLADSWGYEPGFGTAGAVFVEDCYVYQDAQGDSTVETYNGGKVVFRNNTCTNFWLGVHGRDSSVRSGHTVEIYRNVNTINLGTSYPGTINSRGGTGVIWGNVWTQLNQNGSQTTGNNLVLQTYRAAGNLNPDYTLRFPYNGTQLDGHSPYDGNSAVANGTGTHTGADGAAGLTDATKAWGADELAGTGNYAEDNTLQAYFIWNLTTGAGGRITANSGTTATATLAGGTRQTWNTGDSYVITFGYPGLDQNGRSGPTVMNGVQSSQTLCPWYSWDNTFNGAPNALPFSLSYMTAPYTSIAQPDSGQFVQSGREFHNNTPKPGYTPYTYPHPGRRPRSAGSPGSAALLLAN